MSLAVMISIIFGICVAGFLYWLVKFLPFDPPFPAILRGLVVVLTIWWILSRLNVPGIPHLG